ncbi:MAG: hypothetical protein O9308_08025 [Beijerinckiaceae bacterium]|nr:hypothetical protein [Beijerinckiaceae bacterium]
MSALTGLQLIIVMAVPSRFLCKTRGLHHMKSNSGHSLLWLVRKGHSVAGLSIAPEVRCSHVLGVERPVSEPNDEGVSDRDGGAKQNSARVTVIVHKDRKQVSWLRSKRKRVFIY